MPDRPVRQRADLTHKHNRNSGRHGWLRLTPAYSVKLVASVLRHYDTPIRAVDPFSGTGTTALAAAEQGHSAIGTDINPFLVWLGNAKLGQYGDSDIAQASAFCDELASASNAAPVSPPSIHNIQRWWHPVVLESLCAMKGEIDGFCREHKKAGDLLLLAFCQTIIKVSNAAFNHQSMSFKGQKAELAHAPEQCIETFCGNLWDIIDSVRPNLAGEGRVVLSDSRGTPPGGPYDLLLTSPPYPNRMSYVRELRPYMYWLGYLEEAREAGELDWQAIGGTWGIATSRLSDWRPDDEVYLPPSLLNAVAQIKDANDTNGRLLAAYVHKYFCDMWRHFESVGRSMRAGGKAVYIIGNSTFYGVMVSAETAYADMLAASGFVNVQVAPIRKRNSKKELYEFAVEADYAEVSDMGTVAAIAATHTLRLFE